LGEEERTDHAGDSADAVDGALQFAFGKWDRRGATSEIARGAGDAPEARREWHRENIQPRGAKAKLKKPSVPNVRPDRTLRRSPKRRTKGPTSRPEDDAGTDADDGEGQADVAAVPGVAILRVQDEDGGKRLLGEVEESHDAREAEELWMRAEQGKGAERMAMCHADLERRSGGRDSGRTKRPYIALDRLSTAAAQKGKRS